MDTGTRQDLRMVVPARARLLVLPLGACLMARVGLPMRRVQLGSALVLRGLLLERKQVRLPPPGWS